MRPNHSRRHLALAAVTLAAGIVAVPASSSRGQTPPAPAPDHPYGVAIMTNGDRGRALITEIEARVAAACGWDTLDKPLVR